MSKRLLVLDTWSNALDLCMRAQEYGWEVLWWDEYRRDGSCRLAGAGIVPKILDYELIRRKYLDWADLIYLPDNTKYVDLLEPYRNIGYPIFNGCVEASKLELDREAGKLAMKACGLTTIPGVEFNDFAKAAKYVEAHQSFTVCKPSGDANKVLSYVGEDAASLIYMLTKRWPKNDKYVHDAKKHGFILQERKDGVEFAVSGFYGRDGWSPVWYENFEYKKMMDGDLGPTTGEQGTLVMAMRESKLADLALKPITKLLKKWDYCGYVDISGCVDERGAFWPFEYTIGRGGWPISHNITALTQGDPVQWMVDKVNGVDSLTPIYDQACVSVVVSVPDYPNSKFTRREVTGIPIYGAHDRAHIHLSGVMLDDDVPTQVGDKVVRQPGYVTAEDYVLVATGTGDTITGARRSVYAAVRKVRIATRDPQYRRDIGKGRLVEQLPQLQKHGFAKGFSF